MVLDIRFLRDPAGGRPKAPAAAAAALPGAGHPQADPAVWSTLLQQAVVAPRAAQFAELVQQLRLMLPNEAGIEALWGILSDAADPRRHLAALVLGYHRSWLASRSRVRRMASLAKGEPKVQLRRTMVWCLRQQDEVVAFLGDSAAGVAGEAALGLTLNRRSLPAVAEVLLLESEPRPEVESVLLQRLGELHLTGVEGLARHLLQLEAPLCPQRLARLFAHLPQVSLFRVLVEERRVPGCDPQEEGHTRRARRWQELASVARAVLHDRPGPELARYLLTCWAAADAFARRHAPLLREALRCAGAASGGALVAHCARLAERASEESVARLAQPLLELCEHLQGESAAQARALLEAWKKRSPRLRLHIYQIENGLAAG